MKKIILALALLLMVMGSADARMSGVMISGMGTAGEAPGPPDCTTPTGDEVTESWGEGSTSCWTSGSSVCHNTWTISGTLSIEDSPGTPIENTACAKSLKVDASAGTGIASVAIPGGAIAADEAVTINFSVYVDSSQLAAWASKSIVGLNNTGAISSGTALATVMLNNGTGSPGPATRIMAIGVADSCTISISEDTWYDVVVTLPATDSGDQSTMTVNGGAPCTFTKDTDASANLHLGMTDGVGVLYFGNIRVTTP